MSQQTFDSARGGVSVRGAAVFSAPTVEGIAASWARLEARIIMRRPLVTMIFTTAAMALAGCADSGPGVYDGEQSESDVLPAQVTAEGHDYDPETSRLLATHHGYQFFAMSSPTMGDCLLSFDPDAPDTWVAGCNASGGRMGTGGQVGVKTDYAPGGLPEEEAPEGWIRLTPQLQVTED
ncbi:hypothetical protein DEJ38_17205 [Kocuria rosea]|nr:hypothetical protein DEJ38_17205 [Kocuria rosea]